MTRDDAMFAILRYLLLFALLAYGLWPYYHVFRLDAALSEDDPRALQGLLDIQAIREHYKERLNAGVGGLFAPQEDNNNGPMAQLSQGLAQLGDAALEQYVTPARIHDELREATREATQQSPPYLISAVDFAFFESFDHFLIRLGELGQRPTHIRMRLEGTTWRVTDIIR